MPHPKLDGVTHHPKTSLSYEVCLGMLMTSCLMLILLLQVSYKSSFSTMFYETAANQQAAVYSLAVWLTFHETLRIVSPVKIFSPLCVLLYCARKHKMSTTINVKTDASATRTQTPSPNLYSRIVLSDFAGINTARKERIHVKCYSNPMDNMIC